MDDRLQALFQSIHAETALKDKTRRYLATEIRRRQTFRGGRLRKRILALAAGMLLFVSAGFVMGSLFFTASAYIDIDLNPSIELTLNRQGRVIDTQPYNAEGAALLADADIKFSRYADAIDKLIGAAVNRGYMTDDASLSVTLQSNDDRTEAELIDALDAAVASALDAHQAASQTEIYCVSETVKHHAHDNHVSPAKYLAIQELQQVDPTANFGNCAKRSISEIKAMTQSHHSQGDATSSETTGDGCGKHNGSCHHGGHCGRD